MNVGSTGEKFRNGLGLALVCSVLRVMHAHGLSRLRFEPPPHVRHSPTTTAIMRPTARCLTAGFVKRSLDEFKRLSNRGERPIHPLLSPGS